jgi:hypothetical protein
MEYFAQQKGISLETKLNYQRMYIIAEERWRRDGRTWTFFGWQSQLETLVYLERAAKERRKRSKAENG